MKKIIVILLLIVIFIFNYSSIDSRSTKQTVKYNPIENFDQLLLEINDDVVIINQKFDTHVIDRETRKMMRLGLSINEDIKEQVINQNQSWYSLLVEDNSISRYYFKDGRMLLKHYDTTTFTETTLKFKDDIRESDSKLLLFNYDTNIFYQPVYTRWFYKDVFTQVDSNLYQGDKLIIDNISSRIQFSIGYDVIYYVNQDLQLETYDNGVSRIIIDDKISYFTISEEYIYYFSEKDQCLVRVNRANITEELRIEVDEPHKVRGTSRYTIILSGQTLLVYDGNLLVNTMDNITSFSLDGNDVFFHDINNYIWSMNLLTLEKELFYDGAETNWGN